MTRTYLRSLVLAVVLLAVAGQAQAQDRVTVVQRDGGKVSGIFEDWHRPSDIVYVRVTPTDQRRIPLKNVLVMDFGGDAASLAPAETEAAQGGDHVLVTKGGEVLRGRLLNIEGGEGSQQPGEPRMLSFQAGAERRFRMTEVARLYLGNYPTVTAAAPEASVDVPPGALRVAANQQWTQTSITVRRGDRLQFSVSGEIQLSADANDKAISAGSLTGRFAPGAPGPQWLAGALIGRIGGGVPFPIGNQTEPLTMSDNGILWLGVNDDTVSDNSGAFIVTVRVIRGR